MDTDTKAVLLLILETLKDQALYLQRQRKWLAAVADTVKKHPDLEATLKSHPYFDQGPRPDEQIMRDEIQRIDALIRKLMD